MRYFIRLSYSGTHFYGWQVQPGERTVQGELNQCLSHLLREEVHVVGAGRTDTGVHASVMFAHVDVSKAIKQPVALAKRMNRYLKADIAIKEIFAVKEDAHARFSASSRAYVYHINRQKDPFKEGLSYFMDLPLDVDKMNEAAQLLLKHEDYAAFAKNFDPEENYLCRVEAAHWEVQGNDLLFYIRANRFVHNMVRSVVGTLLMVGQGKIGIADFEQIIFSRKRSKAGTSAPAHGLYLVKVDYPNDIYL
jgi:tRNA pseudouridine38-40 synthase